MYTQEELITKLIEENVQLLHENEELKNKLANISKNTVCVFPGVCAPEKDVTWKIPISNETDYDPAIDYSKRQLKLKM